MPNVVASIGFAALQFGLVGSAVAEHSGILTIVTEPGVVVPLPSLATTSSSSPDARSAHTGRTPTGIVLADEFGSVSSAFVCELITETVPSVWFRMNTRRWSSVITPYTGPRPTGSVVEIVLVPVSIAATCPANPLVDGLIE